MGQHAYPCMLVQTQTYINLLYVIFIHQLYLKLCSVHNDRFDNTCRFTFVIAFLLLLTGAALNNQHGEETMYFGNYYCYVVKPGVFAGGAVLAFASVALGILCYLTLNSAKDSNDPWPNPPLSNQSGIAMGQAQFAPHTQDPVFVHEDTYIRRQFT